jgi:hypothetical protein
MNKLIDAIKAVWYTLFPKKTGYFYRLQNDGELLRAPLTEPEKAVPVEDVPEDYLSSAYEEDIAAIECPYNVASLQLLKKQDLSELALDCGLIVTKKDKKKDLVKKVADYFGI